MEPIYFVQFGDRSEHRLIRTQLTAILAFTDVALNAIISTHTKKQQYKEPNSVDKSASDSNIFITYM
jgi:hypothetical protein